MIDPNVLLNEGRCLGCNSNASEADMILMALLQRIAEAGGGGGGTPSLPLNSVQFNNAGAFGGSADLTFNDTTNVLAVVGTLNSTTVLIGNGLVGSPSMAFASDTTTGIYRVGAGRTGFVTSGTLRGEFNGAIFELKAAVPLSFNSITFLRGDDAANEIAQRNGASAQTYKLYRTFTNSTNYERLSLHSAAGQMIVAAETAGTGTDNLDLVLTPAGTGNVTLPGSTTLLKTLAALTDNAGAGAGTLTNAPTAGNPTKWIRIDDAGTARFIPTWT